MVAGIPMAKFLPELFKTMTKPLVNIIKKNVSKSDYWCNSVFIPMAQSVPLAKALPLVLKVVTKPVIETLKKKVRKNPNWENSVFLPIARGYNKMSLRLRLYSQGLKRNKEQLERSAHMTDEAALDLGAELVANTATLFIGLVAIAMQQSLSSASEKKKKEELEEKERDKREEIEHLKATVLDLGITLEHLDTKIREMNRTILSMSAYNKASKEK